MSLSNNRGMLSLMLPLLVLLCSSSFAHAQDRALSSVYVDNHFPAVVDDVNNSPVRFLEPGQLEFDETGGDGMESPESVARLAARFLLRYGDILQASSLELSEPKIKRLARFYTIEYVQLFAGKRVLDSYVALTVGHNGRVIAAGASVYPGAERVATTGLSSEAAEEAVRQHLSSAAGTAARSIESIYYPELADDRYLLVPGYEVVLADSDSGERARGVVDARDGTVAFAARGKLRAAGGSALIPTVFADARPVSHETAPFGTTNSVYGTVKLNYYVDLSLNLWKKEMA